jgi:hypothetical protein
MTYFLDFRTRNVGGAVTDPRLFEGDGVAAPLTFTPVPEQRIPSVVVGKNLLFAVHGFNVSRIQGACSLGTLDTYLNLVSPSLFIGVLWPGDSWLPIVDYPFEGSVSLDCGSRLASFCNNQSSSARSLSFFSHSLGARLVLRAVAGLGRKAQSLCLTAGAINRDCLTSEYSVAADNSELIAGLASRNDDVLKCAFTVGDPFADLLHDDHTPFQAALGSAGPRLPTPQPPLCYPWQIPDARDYGHGDYLPPHPSSGLSPPPGARWPLVADFMKRTFLGQQQNWPPG